MGMVGARHPGGMVRREWLETPGLSVTKAAEELGMSRQALSELVNEKSAVSAEMAIQLSKAFGSSPETWLGMQTAFDLWEARERAKQLRVNRLAPAPTDSEIQSRRAPHTFSTRCL